MKITDIVSTKQLDEAGFWQGVKNLGARMTSPELSQAARTEKYRGQARQQVVGDIIAEWGNWLSALTRRGDMDLSDPIVYQTQLEIWTKQRLPMAFSNNSTPVSVNQVVPGDIKSVGNYITSVYNRSTTSMATPAPQSAGAPGQQSTTIGEPAIANSAPSNPFNSPQRLVAAWEAYKDAGGKFTPALRKTIKDIWMNMGGIKVESKRYKK